MYKIMVVDDEKAIRQYLPKLLDFEEEGFVFVEAAQNGAEALEKKQINKPDLILLDITMPIMTGLDFLKELRKKDTTTKVIILSGYSDFEYAIQAMRYGAEDYLTKPVDEKQLLNLIRKVKAELDETRQQDVEVSIREEVEELKKMFHLVSSEREKLMDCFLLHCVVTGKEKETMTPSINVLKDCLEEIPEEIPEAGEGLFRFRGGVYTYLFPKEIIDRHGGENLFAKHLRHHLKSHGYQTSILYDLSIFFKTDTPFRLDYDNHLYSLLSEVFYNNTSIIVYDEKHLERQNNRLEKEAELFERLKTQVANQEKEAAVETMEFIFNEIKKSEISIEYVQKISYRFYYLLREFVAEEGVLESLDWREQICFLTFDAWKAKELENLETTFIYIKNQLNNKNSYSGREIELYVNQHYKEFISLSGVADEFHMNAAYLGRLFQKTTGVSFKQYVNELRIEEAKRLLLFTDLMIYEIAAQVGFSESKYFITRFTEMTGLSPAEYRKSAKKE